MDRHCFEGDCNSTTGAEFQKDDNNKPKWLKERRLKGFTQQQGTNRTSKLINYPRPSCNYNVIAKSKEIQLPPEQQVEQKVDAIETTFCRVKIESQNTDDKVCRACMGTKNVVSHLNDTLEDHVTIASAIMKCASAIEVLDNDGLPKHICTECVASLKGAYEFQKKCIQTDNILRTRYKQFKRKSVDITDVSSKRSRGDISNNFMSEQLEEPCQLSDVLSSLTNNVEVINEDKDKSETPQTHQIELLKTSKNKISSRRSHRLAQKDTTKSIDCFIIDDNIDIDDIEKSLEQLHGKESAAVNKETVDINSKSKDSVTVEDILNTLEDEDVENENETDILDEFLKKKDSVFPKITENKELKTESNITPQEIKLPKDVKIKSVGQFQSATGSFPCTYLIGLYDNTFIEADDYLYELGLVKGLIRHLRCIVQTCPAQANQKIKDNGNFVMIIDVTIPHIHVRPTEQLKRKQMFLSVLRKKINTDRILNIRVIYEDACNEDPSIRQTIHLRNVVNEVCRHQLSHKIKAIKSFEDFYNNIENDNFEKLHFTISNQQFYQDKFYIEEDDARAVVFGNLEVIQKVSSSKIMYIDSSFKIDTQEDFKYQLMTILVWIDESYYPILFILFDKRSQLLYRKIFTYLQSELAPDLRPQEIITDYEAHLYYAIAEVYVDSNIGGSVFYYTQNLYKKICSLNLSRDLETNSYFRNIYHMLLMLPLLPVNTILDGLNNIQSEAVNYNIMNLAQPLFDYIREQWILNVTPELFCVHKLESRINENVIAPFKKLRDFLLLTKGKMQKTQITIVYVIEKVIELENFLKQMYAKTDKRSFSRDLSSYQKKNVIRAWQFIEDHPKIEINHFFSKVLGYIKCMENQLWIWGFYRYDGDADDLLINTTHFSIVSPSEENADENEDDEEYVAYIQSSENTIVMNAVIDQNGILQTDSELLTNDSVVTTAQQVSQSQQFETAYIKYIYQ